MDEKNDVSQPDLKVFCCYAQKDEKLFKYLDSHLSSLKRQKYIQLWNSSMIAPGANWKKEIANYLQSANIILLLISADFLSSDYAHSIEMQIALKKHEMGEVVIIPISLRPVDLTGTPFSPLQALPRNGRPVAVWNRKDDAFATIAKEIRERVEVLRKKITDSHQYRERSIINDAKDRNINFRERFEINRVDEFYRQQNAFDDLLRRAAPGGRNYTHIQEPRRINRILSLLEEYSSTHNLCFFSGSRSMDKISVHKLSQDIWMVYKFECLVSNIWVYRSPTLERQYILIHRAPLTPSGVYDKTFYDRIFESEYGNEEVGYYKGRYITREEYDDGYTVINGKEEKIENCELRIRNIRDDFLILSPKWSVYTYGNSTKNRVIFDEAYSNLVNAREANIELLKPLERLVRPEWMEYLD